MGVIVAKIGFFMRRSWHFSPRLSAALLAGAMTIGAPHLAGGSVSVAQITAAGGTVRVAQIAGPPGPAPQPSATAPEPAPVAPTIALHEVVYDFERQAGPAPLVLPSVREGLRVLVRD